MKTKMIKLAFFLSALTIGFSSCKKETTNTTVLPPTPTTGGLVVKVQLQGSTGFLSGVDVGLATSQENLDNGIYLLEKTTDASGKANFGQLNPGNYYYDAETTIGSDTYYGEGQIQIVAGRNDELILPIIP